MGNKSSILDYIFLAFIVPIITLQPYYMHGAINFYETGLYLPCIDGVLDGKILYRDIFILRGPLEVYFPALLMTIFGENISILRAYFYFGTVLTLIICAFLGLGMYRTKAFVYLMTPVLIGKTFARVNFNNWGGIRFGIGLLAVLFAVNYFKKEKSIWIFMAGILSVVGFFISLEIGICSGIAILSSLFFASVFKGWGKYLNAIKKYVIGGCIVLFPFFFYFLITGALAPFFDITLRIYRDMMLVFNFPSSIQSPQNFYEFLLALNPFNRNIKYMGPFFIYIGMGIYLLKQFFKKKFEIQDFGILSLAIYGGLLYKSAFRNLEGPQFQMALQPAIILFFLFLERIYLLLKVKRNRLKIGRIFIAVIVLFSLVYSLQRYNRRFFLFKYRKELFVEKQGIKTLFPRDSFVKLDIERAKGVIVSESQAEEITKVVKYLQSRTKSQEEVFTFPDLGTYNFLADRPSLGRFGTVELAWVSEDWHKEVMEQLHNKKPRYILVERDISRLDRYRETLGKYMEETKSYIKNHYRKEVSFGNIDIWKIKGALYD